MTLTDYLTRLWLRNQTIEFANIVIIPLSTVEIVLVYCVDQEGYAV